MMRARVAIALLVLLLGPTALASLGPPSTDAAGSALDAAAPARTESSAMGAGPGSATTATSATTAAAAEDGRYQFYFDCPSEPTSMLTTPCPTRLGVDGSTLGAPSVAIDRASPNRVLVAALAGTLAADGRSRTGDAMHVLFASQDAGRTFTQMAWPAATGATAARDIHLAVDDEGRFTLVSLYTGAAGDFIAVWTLAGFPAAPIAGADARVISPWAQGATIDRLSLTTSPNGTRIILWEEQGTAPDARAASGAAAWVRAALAHPGSAWQITTSALLSAPCEEVSNVVASLDDAFFACRAQTALWPERNLTADSLVLHTLSLANGTAAFRNRAPFTGTPTLGITPEGRVAVAVLSTDDGRLHLRFTTARLGFNWTTPGDPGLRFHGPDAPLAENARVLALTFRPNHRMWHLVFADDAEAAPAGPSNSTNPRENKTAFALSERGSLMFRMGLNVDQFANRPISPSTAPLTPAPLPRDTHDAIHVFGTREVLVYADAGRLVVALVEEVSIIQTPGAVPEATVPDQVVTVLTQQPPRKFTLMFEIATGVLITLAVARVLIGRIIVRASAPGPGEDSQ